MSKHNPLFWKMVLIPMVLMVTAPAWAQEMSEMPSSTDRPLHGESTAAYQKSAPWAAQIEPAIPAGMTLDEVFEFSESPPPGKFPVPIHDDKLYIFTLFDQLEYRIATDDETVDRLGWEVQGWIGGDFNRFWWKNEGEAAFDGPDKGETETDLLYSRLITPYWFAQVGAQYANEWNQDDYADRWSGVIALQGLSPYKFEFDNALYISEDGDVTFVTEAEYDLRITQRLVLQPRVQVGFAFQDIAERRLGAGMTDVTLDLRLRYEIKREFAPYLGVRYQSLVGETDTIAEANGEKTEQLFFLAGLRFWF